ncbi:hypothetical protein IQ241_20050 [Romeria aff. gracilis LEGE 07310]|uniref:Filament integrity protein n=1 Tax=Vasconcelosia minhoensis LEGE 07310 TaxID=915328 RepID=A0A8J7AS08_9CYAN|nr:filament integrity protein FraC [Romeria gracilis]MBE9079561.1 hypothetical protein [Romeria aff. gracilis LEGE 07310]
MGELEPIFPLKAIVFQGLFLLVAIALEAGLLRQRLYLGFKDSVQYATVINLAATVVGWFAFLLLEPLAPPALEAQIISYVLFDRLTFNSWTTRVGAIVLISGLTAFFVTLLIKLKGLELMMRTAGTWTIPNQPERLSRIQRYARARSGNTDQQQAMGRFSNAVLQANALSFSALLLLLLLRTFAREWS